MFTGMTESVLCASVPLWPGGLYQSEEAAHPARPATLETRRCATPLPASVGELNEATYSRGGVLRAARARRGDCYRQRRSERHGSGRNPDRLAPGRRQERLG